MKRKITLSIALSLCIGFLALMSSDSTANAARPRTYIADSGIVALGSNQILRIMVAPVASMADGYTFSIRNSNYSQSGCNGGACMHTLTSQTTTGPITLGPGQAISRDITQIPGSSGVRCTVSSNNPDAQMNVLIIDATTGATVSRGAVLFRLAEDSGGE